MKVFDKLNIRWFLLAALALAASTSACSNADLEPFIQKFSNIPLNNDFKVEGRVCGPIASENSIITYVIISIDESGSNSLGSGIGADPFVACGATFCTNRTEAAKALINSTFDPIEQKFDDNIKYMVLRFNNTVSVCGNNPTTGTAQTINSLQGQGVTNLNGLEFASASVTLAGCLDAQDGASFTDMHSAWVTKREILQSLLASLTPQQANSSKIKLIDETDGVPDDGINIRNVETFPSSPEEDPVVVLQKVQEVADMAPLFDSMELFWFQYGFNLLPTGPGTDLQALALSLGTLSVAKFTGASAYASLTSSSGLTLTGTLETTFSIENGGTVFAVENPYVTFDDEGRQTPDSDGDGLSDDNEFQFGTDPFNPDSDGDGLSDKVEKALGLNPINGNDADATSPTDTRDSDGDGLSDGEEDALNSDPSEADSDIDGIYDGAEVLLELDYLAFDSDQDFDSDGQTNFVEWIRKTPVFIFNDQGMENEALEYDIFNRAVVGEKECYDFKVSNVPTAATGGTDPAMIGVNRLRISAEFTPINGASNGQWFKVFKDATLTQVGNNAEKEPANGVISIDASEFKHFYE